MGTFTYNNSFAHAVRFITTIFFAKSKLDKTPNIAYPPKDICTFTEHVVVVVSTNCEQHQ